MVGLLIPFAYMPLSLNVCLGRQVGRLAYYFLRRRRSIASINIQLCFKELSKKEQDTLVKKQFQELGIALFETNLTWWRSPEFLRRFCTFTGVEHCVGQNQGVLIVGAHFSTIDIVGCMMTQVMDITVTMRRLKNPVFDYMFKRSRFNNYEATLDRKEIKAMLKTLKDKKILWYAPDQDYGADNSIFVPFFGEQAASLKITPKLVGKTHAKVIISQHHREGNHYYVNLLPLAEAFPTDDLTADVTLINRKIEEMVRLHPEQYFWPHRRFKTGPNGDSKIYRDTEALEQALLHGIAPKHEVEHG